jgi:hypothetical protein
MDWGISSLTWALRGLVMRVVWWVSVGVWCGMDWGICVGTLWLGASREVVVEGQGDFLCTAGCWLHALRPMDWGRGGDLAGRGGSMW